VTKQENCHFSTVIVRPHGSFSSYCCWMLRHLTCNFSFYQIVWSKLVTVPIIVVRRRKKDPTPKFDDFQERFTERFISAMA